MTLESCKVQSRLRLEIAMVTPVVLRTKVVPNRNFENCAYRAPNASNSQD
ncbi:hypothetical protein A8990_108102 [Paenibacillus taihuensis]|uniref:Uncharacterized protein n=1 Tax=Paenibacillus taihuensis TaxID=1156355 RepID=A0A3D9SBW7_9BACL|nr:hypothetical protein A8990_108102 [Paenibacillus taihuensis]